MKDTDLFELIFGHNSGWVCLAVIHDIRKPGKSEQGFEQVFYRWPEQQGEIAAWIDSLKDRDCYFCPHLLAEPHRKKDFALPGHTIYADLDSCGPENLGRYGEPGPSIVVQSSPARWQAFWLLRDDVEPDKYEELNRRIALGYKDEGCDQGGWDLTQLLRIPGTTHNKGRPFVVEASPLDPDDQPRCRPEQFNVLPPVAKTAPAAAVTFGQLPQVDVRELKVSNRLKGLIVRGWQEGCGYQSRSELDMAVIDSMVSNGYSDDEIRAVFSKYTVGEKYREQGEDYLKHQIGAARAFIGKEGNMKDNGIIESSFVELPSGIIAEQTRNPDTKECGFAVYGEGGIGYRTEIEFEGKTYRPIDDDLVSHGLILFPSEAVAFGGINGLLADIQKFIHKYVDVRPYYERLASYYALLTWVYDAFSVIPYLRFLGGWSTGKSRGLDVLAAICYKAMQVSGATTISPMFRVMEKFAGTLIIDEADIARGDEYTEFIKVLNTGYQKGKPLLRSERAKGDVFEPRAYNVFCPKIVATRHKYQDQALESRFLTERMDRGFDKERIPLNLPPEFDKEALELRNKLLYFRLTRLKDIEPEVAYAQKGIEPRVWQVLSPMMQLIEDDKDREEFEKYARAYTQVIRQDRTESLNGEVVDILFGLVRHEESPTVKAICNGVNEKYHEAQDRLTPSKVGRLLRGLGLVTKRHSEGYYVDLEASGEAIELIKRQYDVAEGEESGPSTGTKEEREEARRLREIAKIQ